MKHVTVRRSARLATVSATALLTLASLAGCGGSDGGSATDEPTTSVSTTTSSDPTSDPASDPTADESSAPAPGGEPIDAQDFIDVYSSSLERATTATISMAVSGPASSTIDGAIDFTTEPPAVRMSVTSDQTPEPQEILIVDGDVYFQAPGGKYVRTSLDDSPISGSAGGSGLDPRALIDQLGDSILSATAYGDEDVDGEVLTHYGVLLDAKALAAASGTTEVPGVSLPDQLAFDSYFDDQGLLRRITIDLGGAAGTVDVRYDSWGEPVDIKAPPESQVQELPTS